MTTAAAAVTALVLLGWPRTVHAGAFEDYRLVEVFQLPAGDAYDVLPDGRIIATNGASVLAETSAGSRSFAPLLTIPGMDVGFGNAFARVSPNGSLLAVGNNGGGSFANYEIAIVDLNTTATSIHAQNHFDAAWADDSNLLITGGAFGQPASVVQLDATSSPASPSLTTIISGIGGASGGVAVDGSGWLYTANGFTTSGPSGTGEVKAFAPMAWQNAGANGALDFEHDGVLAADLLSGNSLAFDVEGNLLVGGGDSFVGTDFDYAGLVNTAAVAAATSGIGPAINPSSPLSSLRKLDPEPSVVNTSWFTQYNPATEEVYVRGFASPTVYVYRTTGVEIPEPMSVALLGAGMLGVLRRRRSC